MDKGGIDPFVVIHPVVFVNSDWCREQMLNAFIAALLNIIAGCIKKDKANRMGLTSSSGGIYTYTK